MAHKPANKTERTKVDYNRLWKEAEARSKSQEPARHRAWLGAATKSQERVSYSSLLVIPSSLNDYGVRPLPSGTPCWVSPFIGVNSPDPSGQPLAGAENFLTVRIFNLGAGTAAPTKVEFYAVDPSAGLNPADLAADLIPHPEHALFHATEQVEVQPLKSVVVTCGTPWIPSYVNGGHECVFVTCDNYILDSEPRHPFDPTNDRRVGQHNFFVLPAVEQTFQLWVPLASTDASAEIRVLPIHGVAPRGFVRRNTDYATVAGAAQEVLRGLRQPSVAQARAEHTADPLVFAQRVPSERVIHGLKSLDETRPIRSGPGKLPNADLVTGADIGEMALRLATGPGTAVRLELRLHALDLTRDEIVVLNIVHVAMGIVTGGYTLALVNPTWFAKSPLATTDRPR